MEALKAAMDWARAEVFSSAFFILFGIMFLAGSIGFWQLGKTEQARAYIIPMLTAGILLSIIGAGLVYSNQKRIKSFPEAFERNAPAFVQAEISRAQKTAVEYQNVVFKAFPLIIAIAALLIVFVDKPVWRAIGVTTIAMLVVIILIDSNAHARISAYQQQMESMKIQESN